VNTRHKLRMAFVTVVLLPTSCLAGKSASDQLDARTDGAIIASGPNWYENLLWLIALALMVVWAWAMNRLWNSKDQ